MRRPGLRVREGQRAGCARRCSSAILQMQFLEQLSCCRVRTDPARVELLQDSRDMPVALAEERLADGVLAREQQAALVDFGAARDDGAALFQRRAMRIDRLAQRDDAVA